MTLDEIRKVVAGSGREAWQILKGDAPTYIGRFVERHSDGERWREFLQHDQRAVLRRDVDIGLVWGMTADPHNEAVEPHWTEAFRPREAYPDVVEVLYRGQPVDREVYAMVDNAHGLVPWPSATPTEPEALWVTRWQFNLVELLDELGASVGVGSVEEYMGRCGITVVD